MDKIRERALETGVYEVVPGDTLWGISQRILGNPYRYREIFDCNRDVIEDEDLILPSMVLRLPRPITTKGE